MSFLSGIFRLCNRLAGITPDPDLDLLDADRVTTDFYPYEGGRDYLVRMYAEKQVHSGRMKIKFQFQHVKGDAFKAAMMDSAVNDFTPAEHSNLSLREALRSLTAFITQNDAHNMPSVSPPSLDDEVSLEEALKVYLQERNHATRESNEPSPKP